MALRTLMTFVSARIVLEQLQGPAGPTASGSTSYNQQAYLDLMDFLGTPMKGEGGDEWLAAVMRKNQALGMRLMEVRDAYLEEFNWAQVAEVVKKETRAANTRIMRDTAMASLQASVAAAAAAATPAGGAAAGGGGGESGAGAPGGAARLGEFFSGCKSLDEWEGDGGSSSSGSSGLAP